MDKYHRFNLRCEHQKLPIRAIPGGLKGYGAERYIDGYIYKGRSKKPIGRYLRVERIGGSGELALNWDRLADIHTIEQMRWGVLTRIKEKLLPENARRQKLCREYGRREKVKSFNGVVRGCLMTVNLDRELGEAIGIQKIEEAAEPLDRLAQSATTPEADRLATMFYEIKTRLTRAWKHSSTLTNVLFASLELKLRPSMSRADGMVEYAQGTVNGRVYTIWIGYNYHRDGDITRSWPSPFSRAIDLDVIE
jgi:hypothetical protein